MKHTPFHTRLLIIVNYYCIHAHQKINANHENSGIRSKPEVEA